MSFETWKGAANDSLSQVGFQNSINGSHRCCSNLSRYISGRITASGAIARNCEIEHNRVCRYLAQILEQLFKWLAVPIGYFELAFICSQHVARAAEPIPIIGRSSAHHDNAPCVRL